MDLSILIPSRNEMFLRRTVEDILEHIEADTEIVVVLDGAWADPPLDDHDRVTIVYHPVSIGQRAATNEAARLARGQHMMKCDAHCSFGQGFDRIMLEDIQPDWTMVPLMRNLHAFDWVCQECGHRRYQGLSGQCPECGGKEEREILWRAKPSPKTTAMRFDRDLKFRYWGDYKKRQEGDLVDTMSILGACWMLSREKYFELNICDELHGSWGQMGTEIACKTHLSGGRLVCTKKTWFAHLFRTQGGDFGFPYPLRGSDVQKARDYSKWLFVDGNWEGAKYPLSWLIEKFAPVPDWDDVDPVSEQPAVVNKCSKVALYYTCNTHDPIIEDVCRRQLVAATGTVPFVSVSREPIQFGEWNIVVDAPRSAETMHRQIIAGLERIEAEYVFLCESDVLYHRSHFDFTPPRNDTFYFNTNVWRVRYEDGHAIRTDDLQQVSGICAARDLLLDFYRQRVREIEEKGFDRHYEPGHKTGGWKTENWQSVQPNVDLRHNATLTRSKWSPDEFRNKRYAEGWQEANEVPWWGQTAGRMNDFLNTAVRV